jgi:nucleoside-diphosphate-sugar epimerase
LKRQVPYLALGSTSSSYNLGTNEIKVFSDSLSVARQFRPNWFFDFAHMTMDRQANFDPPDFLEINKRINEMGLSYLSIPEIKYAVFTSSGAAVRSDANPYFDTPYGQSKRVQEQLVLDQSSKFPVRVAILRPWSVTGTFCQRPLDYAFSNIATQALQSRIVLKNAGPVIRRYISVSDFLTVGSELLIGKNENLFLDSGGDLVSLHELAKIFSQLTGAEIAKITHQEKNANYYFSSNEQWLRAVSEVDFKPMSIIDQAETYLSNFRSP